MALRKALLAHAQVQAHDEAMASAYAAAEDKSGSSSGGGSLRCSNKTISVSKLRVILKRVFRNLDEDGNGSLSTEELRHFCLAVGMSDDKMLDLLVNQIDINRYNLLSSSIFD
jgi:hypothetical protein